MGCLSSIQYQDVLKLQYLYLYSSFDPAVIFVILLDKVLVTVLTKLTILFSDDPDLEDGEIASDEEESKSSGGRRQESKISPIAKQTEFPSPTGVRPEGRSPLGGRQDNRRQSAEPPPIREKDNSPLRQRADHGDRKGRRPRPNQPGPDEEPERKKNKVSRWILEIDLYPIVG